MVNATTPTTVGKRRAVLGGDSNQRYCTPSECSTSYQGKLCSLECLLVGLYAGECSYIVAGDVSLSACLEGPSQPPVAVTVVDYLEIFTCRGEGEEGEEWRRGGEVEVRSKKVDIHKINSESFCTKLGFVHAYFLEDYLLAIIVTDFRPIKFPFVFTLCMHVGTYYEHNRTCTQAVNMYTGSVVSCVCVCVVSGVRCCTKCGITTSARVTRER